MKFKFRYLSRFYTYKENNRLVVVKKKRSFYIRMVTVVMNICISSTLYINICPIMWCYSKHSGQLNKLVLWQYSCSRSIKVCFESISYMFCYFWGPTEWSTGGHLFWPDRIHEFVKLLEEQKEHVLFLQYLWWCYSVNR